MKLISFQNNGNYEFILEFENKEKFIVNLEKLLCTKVKFKELESAHIDKDWGCLEFDNGMVDIEPKTLYRY